MKSKAMEFFIIATLFIGFFSLLYLIVFREAAFPETVASILNIMVGCLGTTIITIVNYFFGSSSSSRNKDDIISNLKSNSEVKS